MREDIDWRIAKEIQDKKITFWRDSQQVAEVQDCDYSIITTKVSLEDAIKLGYVLPADETEEEAEEEAIWKSQLLKDRFLEVIKPKEVRMEKDLLSGWVFTYNTYTNKWKASKREHYGQLFSGDKGDVLSSSSIDTLQELIIRTGGDKVKLKELINDNG